MANNPAGASFYNPAGTYAATAIALHAAVRRDAADGDPISGIVSASRLTPEQLRMALGIPADVEVGSHDG